MSSHPGALAALVPLLLAVACASNSDEELRVFAAASLVDVFTGFEKTFEADNPGVDVVVQPGGSTQLATQIVEGAPADVFAAASEASMALVTSTPEGIFATNRLVIVTPPDNPGGVDRLGDLTEPDLVVAICDEAVPCGDLTQRVLAEADLDVAPDTAEPNVRAVLNKVVLDEVDAGIVYASDAVAAGTNVHVIPIDSDLTNSYPIVALGESATARRFVEFVLSDQAGEQLEEAGFGAP